MINVTAFTETKNIYTFCPYNETGDPQRCIGRDG